MELELESEAEAINCAIVAMDTSSSFCYSVCASCERKHSDEEHHPICRFCSFNASKLVYKILLSVALETKVIVVVCFDRAARVLFGCSADELFHFAKLHPFAVATAAKVLEGEMFRMKFSKSKTGNAEHLRVVSILPLSSDFRPLIHALHKLYANPSSHHASS